jgi:hypothetical protein
LKQANVYENINMSHRKYQKPFQLHVEIGKTVFKNIESAKVRSKEPLYPVSFLLLGCNCNSK